MSFRAVTTLSVFLVLFCRHAQSAARLSDERIIFQTRFGHLELALYPEVAPVTSQHILKLAKLGAYNTVNFFRVDKGFVAQTADVVYGRMESAPLDARQTAEGKKTVPLEVQKDVIHDRKGILSMGRHSDPNSGGSSFSILLNPAPHLDQEYTIFGEVTNGFDTLSKFEEVETTRDGIFVMPKERISIESSYVICERCERDATEYRSRLRSLTKELETMRSARLPGN